MTIEHIIPEAIGGKLTINSVCKDCNSFLGTQVDAPFMDSITISLPREQYQLKGKKGKLPSIFDGEWKINSGQEGEGESVRIINGTPKSIRPIANIQQQDENSCEIHVKMPEDMPVENQKKFLLTQVRKAYSKLHPNVNIDTPEMLKKFNNEVNSALLNKSISSSKPKLVKRFTIDLKTYFREYLKIAYELAFCKYGMDYVINSQSAHDIREAIKSGEVEKYQIIGEIPYLPKKDMDLYPTAEHELLFCGNIIAIKIFGIWGRIKVFSETEYFTQRKDDFFQDVIRQDNDAQIDEYSGGLIIWHKHMDSSKDSSENAKEEK